jgi:hypothetical protein
VHSEGEPCFLLESLGLFVLPLILVLLSREGGQREREREGDELTCEGPREQPALCFAVNDGTPQLVAGGWVVGGPFKRDRPL